MCQWAHCIFIWDCSVKHCKLQINPAFLKKRNKNTSLYAFRNERSQSDFLDNPVVLSTSRMCQIKEEGEKRSISKTNWEITQHRMQIWSVPECFSEKNPKQFNEYILVSIPHTQHPSPCPQQDSSQRAAYWGGPFGFAALYSSML